MKLGPKLFISFLIAVSAAVLFVLYFSYAVAQERLAQHYLESLIITADAKGKHLEYFFRQIQEEISRASSHPEFYEILSGVPGQQKLQHVLLDLQEKTRDDIFGVEIVNPAGEEISSTVPETENLASVRKVYKERIQNFDWGKEIYVSDIFILPEGGNEHDKIFFITVVPLYDPTNAQKILGYTAYYLNLDKLQVVFENETGLTMYLVNRQGVIVGKSSFLEDFMLRRAVKSLPVEKCLAGGSTSGVYQNNQGVTVLGASACIDRWTFVIEMRRDQVMGVIAVVQQRMAIVAVLILGEILILMYFLTQFIVKPLRELSDTVDRFGKGAWGHRSLVQGEDEIGVLAHTFNRMADTLQDLYEHLEDKVKERTQDLQKFKLAVENASDHITITDTDGIALYVNKAAEKLTGYKAEEMIGQSALLWRSRKGESFWETLRTQCAKTKKAVAKEITNRRKSGKRYISDVHISPIFDDDGQLRFFVMMENDITKAKEVDKSKSEFVSLASHQLRTPLSAINWYIELLLSGDAGDLTEEQQSYLKEVYAGSQRMVELVNALLNVSRIELGTFSVAPELLYLPDIAESVIGELKPQIVKKNIVVDTQYASDVPTVQADKQLVRIIFQNLLSNAVKYTLEKGSVGLHIALEKNKNTFKKQYIRITVSDTGYGIPSNQQTKIFTKLFRADNAKEHVPEGNGLGLYLVKSILQHVGGSIRFESEEGKGTTFYVLLPVEMGGQKGETSLS